MPASGCYDSLSRLDLEELCDGKRDGAGRKSAQIDLGELEKLCSLQCTDEDVAAFFGVTVRTIERRRHKPAFAGAMESGRAKGRLSLRRSLFTQSNNGNTAASIFLAKNVLGYRGVRSNQHSGPDGGPIAIQNSVDLTRLSPEDFEQLQALVDKAERNDGENQ